MESSVSVNCCRGTEAPLFREEEQPQTVVVVEMITMHRRRWQRSVPILEEVKNQKISIKSCQFWVWWNMSLRW